MSNTLSRYISFTNILIMVLWLFSIYGMYRLSLRFNYYWNGWAVCSLVVTSLYGVGFYGVTWWQQKSDNNAINGILLVSIILLIFITTTAIQHYYEHSMWNYKLVLYGEVSLSIVILFFVTDISYALNRKRMGFEDYRETLRVVKYVDFPFIVALLVIVVFGYRAEDSFEMEVFQSGATAFQLLVFNTAFTMALLTPNNSESNINSNSSESR